MPRCNTCGDNFQWGLCDGKWVLLEPVESHDDLDRTFIDENGELRADHRDRHPGGGSINVQRLERKIHVEEVEEEQPLRRRLAEAARVVKGSG